MNILSNFLYLLFIFFCMNSCALIHELGHLWASLSLRYSAKIYMGIGKVLYDGRYICVKMFPISFYVKSDILDCKNYSITKEQRRLFFAGGIIFNMIFGVFMCGIGVLLSQTYILQLGFFSLAMVIVNVLTCLPPNDIWNIFLYDSKKRFKNEARMGLLIIFNFIIQLVLLFFVLKIVFF